MLYVMIHTSNKLNLVVINTTNYAFLCSLKGIDKFNFYCIVSSYNLLLKGFQLVFDKDYSLFTMHKDLQEANDILSGKVKKKMKEVKYN